MARTTAAMLIAFLLASITESGLLADDSAPELVTPVTEPGTKPIIVVTPGQAGMTDAFADQQPAASFFGDKIDQPVGRIVFVIDCSGSMNTTFDYVKAELRRSIASLKPTQQFAVVFFAAGQPIELKIDGKAGLFNATRPNIKAAQQWVQNFLPKSMGGSRAAGAIRRAFDLLAGQPGVIWLLTDGFLQDKPDEVIAKLNEKKQVRVNTIMFVDRMPEAEKLLKKIAADNGGKYLFISEDDLTNDSYRTAPPPASQPTTQSDTTFFRLPAGGHFQRVIFLVDCSGSMHSHFGSVKKELKRAIGSLAASQEFTIIMFADSGPVEMTINNKRGLVCPTAEACLGAVGWIDKQQAGSKFGKTLPAMSIERAFDLFGGQPGVIFLLTDGLILEDPDKLLAKLNVNKRVRVNTILFVDRLPDGEELLKKIAAENGGWYRFVPESELEPKAER